jgi:hypothetical protein
VSAALLVSIFVADILPIFVVAGIGFVLARHFDVAVKPFSRVTFNALAPCLIFNAVVTSTIPAHEFGQLALFCVVSVVIMGAIGGLAAALLRLDRPGSIAFLLVVMFSNSGNYGLPVALFAFGRAGLTYASIYFVVSSVLLYTAGVMLAASGRRPLRRALAGLVSVPAVYGAAAAALILALDISLPTAVMRPVTLLSDAGLPMMLLVLGMQLERAARPEQPAAVVTAAMLSLLMAPLVAIVVASGLGLTGPARQAAVVQASMPAAVVTTILALEFEVAPSFVTSVVFISTAFSPFTLTALIAYLQRTA